ncbi:MAG: WecB/TagA/CpsF family glycosyltransferase, partial [Gloeomargarita sp. SKYG116]|nr:WecB/TagA/CpsF family glycosyltransferase [Gloeomargarita sp. SKYG116]MDW8402425.1 WecB/TagA/CpsF family glycosyltransferase [Gloeomargarita sp. SKYGB_i_bin116]
MTTSRLTVQGLPVDLYDDYYHALYQRLQQRQGTHVVTLNAEMVMQACRQPALRTVIQQAELVVPDGVGITLYLKLRGRGTYHAPGIDLVSQVLDRLQGELVFFLGGAPGVAEQAIRYWQQRNPNLVIAGYHHGYFTPAEENALVDEITQKQPR